jgi:molecular chaperone GrpE
MNSDQEIEELEVLDEETDNDDSFSVDDFIRELEEKEKDLHITSSTTVIEIEEGFDADELPDFLKEEFGQEDDARDAAEQPQPSQAGKASSAEVERLREKVAKMDEERTELFKSLQRRAKDFDNFKARTERERTDTFQSQIVNLATLLLPALDDLDRAIKSADRLAVTKSSEFQQFFDGIVLVNEQVNNTLSQMGIRRIEAVGAEFDPHLHEAVATEETDEFEPNLICYEILRGYRIGDRVLRHSMVKVARRPAQPADDISELDEAIAEHPADADEMAAAASKSDTNMDDPKNTEADPANPRSAE